MIKNIIFDIGGVIVAYKRETYLNYFNFKNEVHDKLMNGVFFGDNWMKLSLGKITHEQFVENAKNAYPEISKEIEMSTDNQNYIHMMPPFEKTVAFIKELKKRGYKLFVISDTEENSVEYFTREIPGFEAMFDDLIYSCRVGMVKKNGDIFDYAINRFNVDPSETLFIDDVTKNLNQAKKRGIQTIQFTSPDESIPEIEELLK